MAKKQTKVHKQKIEELSKEFIEWYIEELKNPSEDMEKVPFLIDIKFNKKGSESITILGEENVKKYLEKKK